MDTVTFWKLIETAKQESNGNSDQQVSLLVDALAALPTSEIIEFDTILDHFMALSYTNELWAAAYIINGGCSDDCFDYFRGWLIAQGETVFQNALRDPECLVDIAELEDIELEDMLRVARFAYESKTGSEMPEHNRTPWTLTGDEWDDVTVDAKYPKLAARFS